MSFAPTTSYIVTASNKTSNMSFIYSVILLSCTSLISAATQTEKRSLPGWEPWSAPWASSPWSTVAVDPWHLADHGVSAAELAGAVAAAKEASAAVMAAQHQVNDAKHTVLNQQRLASAKDAAAAETIQRSEAVANAVRAQALAAAQAVVGAQTALAAAKARVAAAQRVAAAREADAARILHRSAHQQAAQLHKADVEAVKLSVLASSGAAGAAGAAHNAAAARNAAIHPPWAPSPGPWAPVPAPWVPAPHWP